MDQTQYDMVQAASDGSAAGSAIVGIIYLAILVLIIASLWKLFTKAGEPGWASIVPIYNTIVLLKIAGKPMWWFVLMLIPLVNFVVAILVTVSLAKAFGKGVGFALGLIFLPFVFMPMIAFGDAQYEGAAQPALA